MRPAEAEYAYKRVAYEKSRKAYPEGFPVLPEIPGGRYFDQRFYDLEMEHVWRKTWVTAGHVSQLPREGSYISFNRLGVSVVIVRDKAGDIRAFHNVCRHRGAPLVLEESGRVPRFVCPYHSWSYALDGKVLGVTCKEDFTDEVRGRNLLPVHCDVWKGMIFINLADEPAMTLAEHMRPLDGQIAGFPLEDLVVKRVKTVYADCNWKAMLDNFYEGYHVATIHQASVVPWLDTKAMAVDIFNNGHGRLCTTRKIFARIDDGTPSPVVKGCAQVFNDHTTGLCTFPNNQAAVEPGGFPWQSMWPLGPSRTVMDLWIMGVDDPAIDPEIDKAYWDRYDAENDIIIGEDMHLLSAIQRSLEGGAFTGMTMGAQERAIYWYHEEIDRRIGIDNIPQELRVQQVLKDHVTPDDLAQQQRQAA
jgi:phenylpropionate dioxygenase-like ring-hydroxylating dioxygenase large terminal subunit